MSWLKDFFNVIIELVKKLDQRQSFIILILIITFGGSYLFYKDYNQTRIALAVKGSPALAGDNKAYTGVAKGGYVQRDKNIRRAGSPE